MESVLSLPQKGRPVKGIGIIPRNVHDVRYPDTAESGDTYDVEFLSLDESSAV